MQVYTNSKRDSIKTLLFFGIILFIAYLPVSSFLFFLKNDAFNGYFPPKFFMSESIHSGYLPLWNPYINFGLPQYGDMSSGFWSPVTWLIASTIGYNAYSFTIELLIYILTAGIGMYILCKFYEMNRSVCMIAGLSYMCCGYMIGHLQHFNWISGAAFLPLCLWAYHKLKKNFSLKNILAASILFYLLAASAHPGIMIGALYFFSAYAVFSFFRAGSQTLFIKEITGFAKTNIVLLIGIVLLSIGMIAGYADILPNITRGEKVSEVAAMANPVSIQSSISALLPLSIVKNDQFFATDLSMRNIYFGLTLLLFFLVSLFTKKNGFQKFFLLAGIGFFLLSSGGIFKSAAIKWLPLIGYVRLNGEFAVFAMLCFILTAAFSLNNYIQTRSSFAGALKVLYYLLEIIIIVFIVFGIYKTNQTHSGFIYQLKNIAAQPGIAQKIKLLIDSMNYYDACWLQGIIQLLLLWGIKWCLINRNFSRLVKIVAADLIIASLFNIPFTGVGKASVAEVQAVLNRSPKGIIVAPLTPINQNDTITAYESGLVGNWNFYNKQPGVKEFAFYPIELNNTKLVFKDPNASRFNKPYVFACTDSLSNKIFVNKFTGSSISITAESKGNDTLVFQQNFYHYWYVADKNKKVVAGSYDQLFLAAPVKAGTNNIEFVFDPVLIKKAMLLSAIAFVLYAVILVILFFRRPSPSSHPQ